MEFEMLTFFPLLYVNELKSQKSNGVHYTEYNWSYVITHKLAK
jgi:hypothetical protein